MKLRILPKKTKNTLVMNSKCQSKCFNFYYLSIDFNSNNANFEHGQSIVQPFTLHKLFNLNGHPKPRNET